MSQAVSPFLSYVNVFLTCLAMLKDKALKDKDGII
jgi:hypothetical protein